MTDTQSFYTYEQWQWLKERYEEGYSIKALSAFIGIDQKSIRMGFVRLGFYSGMKLELPPLAERKEEFLTLGCDTQSRQLKEKEKRWTM